MRGVAGSVTGADAHAFLNDAMSELIVATDAGGERLVRARAMLRTASAFAAESALQILDRLSAAAGAVAILLTDPDWNAACATCTLL